MRLFIAINFDDAVKDSLLYAQTKLREHALRGNFTVKDNLHLTLVFIGEVQDMFIDTVKKSMDTLTLLPFELEIKDVGSFKRDRGDIWWMGISRSAELTELHRQLVKELSSAGISFDNKPYTPHLTLARDVTLDNSFDKTLMSRDISLVHTVVDRVSLMKSERLSGKLIYTEIHSKYLVGEKSENK